MSLNETPKICVVIRKRPINRREQARSDHDIIECSKKTSLTVREIKYKVDLTKYIEESHFRFDRSYDEQATNAQIYMETIRPLVDAAFNRAKVTCFAYGQTGSGKTYTMMGQNEPSLPQVPGLYLLAAQDIFQILERKTMQNFSIFISFYEIYCGKVYDLLNDQQLLHVREDAKQNVNIVGLQETKVNNIQTLMQLINYGMSVRVTDQTGQNDTSSRSHAILQIQIKENETKLHGKISFIDLAGSERAADVTEQNKQTRIDGAEINKSLLALKECIRALDQDKTHTPFRGSKLTLVLRDSFIGHCKTVMIGNISPASSASENTLNTLRYADRVKELKKANKQPLSTQQQMMLPRQNASKQQNYVQNVVNKTQQRFSQQNNPNTSSTKQLQLNIAQQDVEYEGMKINPNIPIQLNFNLNNAIHTNQTNTNTHAQTNQTLNTHGNLEDPLLTTPKHKSQFQMDLENFNHPQSEPQPSNQIPQQYQSVAHLDMNMPFQNNHNFNLNQSMQIQRMSHQEVKNQPFTNNQSSNNFQNFQNSNANINQSSHYQANPNNLFQNQQTFNTNNLSNAENSRISQSVANQQNNCFQNNNNLQNNNPFQNNLNNLQNNTLNNQQNTLQNSLQNNLQNNRQTSLQNNFQNNTNPDHWQQQTPSQKQVDNQEPENPNLQSYLQSQTLFPANNDFLQSMEIQNSIHNSIAKPNYFQSNSKNLQDIQKQHDRLIQQILSQEELLIKTHKHCIDQNVSLTQQDMQILHEVDKPGSDIERYLSRMEDLLNQKQNQIDSMRNVVTQFRAMMKQEESLSYTFYQKRNEQMQIEVQEFQS